MSDLISRDALIKEVLESREAFRRGSSKTKMHDMMCDNAISWVEGAPAVDAVPVVHGEWISVPGKKSRVCSNCEKDEPYKFAPDDYDIFDFCPNCGAKMDGGERNG